MQDGLLKKFLRRFTAFVLLLPVVWCIFICVWGSLVQEKYRKNLVYDQAQGFPGLRFKQADTTQTVQLMVVGSSHVYRGIDPRILSQSGISSFNLGSSLQTPVQTEYLLKRYLPQMNPKVVIFEVGFKTFSSDGVESALDIISNLNTFDGDILSMVLRVNDVGVFNSFAYSVFRRSVLGETRDEYLARHNQSERYIDGGFVERTLFDYEGPTEFDTIPKPIASRQRKAFERCLQYLRDRNVEVILIQTPVLYDYYTSIQNYKEYNSYFMRSGSSTYFNFSDSVYNDTEFFYDHHHLNQKGVEKFNEDLLQILQAYFPVVTGAPIPFNDATLAID